MAGTQKPAVDEVRPVTLKDILEKMAGKPTGWQRFQKRFAEVTALLVATILVVGLAGAVSLGLVLLAKAAF